MSNRTVAALVLASVAAACATAPTAEHGGMSHEEMARHCQMMDAHHADGAASHAHHDPARHGGMTHEEMIRHCAEMRAGEAAPQR